MPTEGGSTQRRLTLKHYLKWVPHRTPHLTRWGFSAWKKSISALSYSSIYPSRGTTSTQGYLRGGFDRPAYGVQDASTASLQAHTLLYQQVRIIWVC